MLCKIYCHYPDPLFSMAKMFFSKNRDFQIFDIQIDAETAFFARFFWNLICNPLKCPCQRGRGCGVLKVSLQPKHGAYVLIIGIWGFFLFLRFPPFSIKKQNKTCSNMSQKLRVKPLSLSDNLQERLDTWLGRIRRVKRSKMATRKFCSTFFTIFKVFLLCFTHLSAREVKKCLSWLYLMLSWTYSVDRFGPEPMPDH